ncbi:putative alcohol dehydrogenase [Phaeomoniella chlamydospora]|uniref:Putative alcohol dehydrogenase n=1 Tax=Phaeomoniella chlamydospora TaxID=158046 RepID=A0A0G2EGH7_PHACM|nr:putative alcohol dehydrogenase [Phaeomoniella chlamydospora]
MGETSNILTKAYVVNRKGDPFVLSHVVLDEVQENEVLIEMKYTGLCHTSSLSKLAVVAEASVVKIAVQHADLRFLAPLSCGYLTGAGTILNILRPQTVSKLAVVGMGAVGLAAMLAAKALGVRDIVAVDIVDEKLQLASDLGASHTVNTKAVPDLNSGIRAIFPDGVDQIVDTTGVATLLQASIKALAHEGTLALLIPQLIQLYQAGKFPIDRISKCYPAECLPEAIEYLKSGRTLVMLRMVVVNPDLCSAKSITQKFKDPFDRSYLSLIDCFARLDATLGPEERGIRDHFRSRALNKLTRLLAGKVSVITGASSGLGRAIALTFVRHGAMVVCAHQAASARHEQPTHELIRQSGGKSIFKPTDVGNAESMQSLVQSTVKEFGRLDIMVNNAGIAPEASEPRPVWETTEEDFDSVCRVNIRGVFLGCKYGGAQMIKQARNPQCNRAGTIINMASVLGVLGLAGTPVNALSPVTRTPMISKIINDNESERHLAQLHPLQRLGTPDEIANAAVFLASEMSEGITGVNLSVDGGLHAQLKM